MGPQRSIPPSMKPGLGHEPRNGPRPMPGQPRSPPAHVTHGPGYAGTSHGSQDRPLSSKDFGDGEKDKKKKKKLGLF